MIIEAGPLAALARQVIERHDDWDGLHVFATVHPAGDGTARIGRYVAIDPGIDPGQYPELMFDQAAKHLEKSPGDNPAAYLLMIEGWQADEPPRGDPRHEQWATARRDGTFNELPFARETAGCWIVDVHDRVFMAEHDRVSPALITEDAFPAGAGRVPGGRLIHALRALASVTGQQFYGLPPFP